VFKAIIGSLFVLTSLAFLAGCGRDGTGTASPEAASTAATAPAGSDASKPHPVPSAAPGADIDLSGIARAEGGKTIREIYDEKDQLAGKPVSVRGKIVKANAGIMGKNWLHLRDGYGTGTTSDLTVTTSAVVPKVGDTVLVTGKVSLNKDFGMGYQYDVIIEDADVKVE
jgi:hypothetical protein